MSAVCVLNIQQRQQHDFLILRAEVFYFFLQHELFKKFFSPLFFYHQTKHTFLYFTVIIDNQTRKSMAIEKHEQDYTDAMQEDETSQLLITDPTNIPSNIISPISLENLPLNIVEQLKKGLLSQTIAPHLFFNQPAPPPPNHTMLPTDPNTTTNKKDTKPKVLSPDERRQRRLLRNRLAAKDCRKKKKEYVQHMEETITRLEKEKVALTNQIDELKEKIALLPDKQVIMESEDNYKLMKEVEELNAKLGNMK